MTEYRSPIVVVLAHIDHGKTSLLDRIRETKVTESEAGGITQSMGSTFIPMPTIENLCTGMFRKFGIKPSLKGLLFIDTPGHEAFTSMRQRGSLIADIAVLLVDINEGFMPQTFESLRILKETKTPFVIALNKIDRFFNWHSDSKVFLDNIENQPEQTKNMLEDRLYKIAAELEKEKFRADRFDRISDFSKEIAIVPISAKTGEGISELLFVITGLAEKFLKPALVKTDECRGAVLEVKETKGLGTTIDAIIHDGRINRGDYIVIEGREPVITKIKALLVPRTMQDMRTEKRFEYIDFVDASDGVRIFASGLSGVIAGSDFRVAKTMEHAEEMAKGMKKEEKTFKREKQGIILKADTLGGLEAMINLFSGFEVKYGDVGNVTKNDIINSEINQDPTLKAILCFNMNIAEEMDEFAKSRGIRVFCSPVIYHLVDDYKKWKEKRQMEIEMEHLKGITMPAKMRVIPGCIFRASKPAVFGCEIEAGTIKSEYPVFRFDSEKNEIVELGKIKQIQSEGNNIEKAERGEKVALSVEGAFFEKNFHENDIIYTDIRKRDFEVLKNFEKILSPDQKEALEDIRRIKNLY